jgi:hypothetical protein
MTSPNGRSRCPHRTREGAVSGQKRRRFPATPSPWGRVERHRAGVTSGTSERQRVHRDARGRPIPGPALKSPASRRASSRPWRKTLGKPLNALRIHTSPPALELSCALDAGRVRAPDARGPVGHERETNAGERAEHCALLCPERSRTSLWSVAPAGERPVSWRRSKRPPRGIQDPVDGIFLMADLTQDSPQRPL